MGGRMRTRNTIGGFNACHAPVAAAHHGPLMRRPVPMAQRPCGVDEGNFRAVAECFGDPANVRL